MLNNRFRIFTPREILCFVVIVKFSLLKRVDWFCVVIITCNIVLIHDNNCILEEFPLFRDYIGDEIAEIY